MSLQSKYDKLISAVREKSADAKITEQDGVLYIDGQVSSEGEKNDLWNVYNSIDPDYRTGDVRLNLEVNDAGQSFTEYTVKPGDSLSKIGSKHGVTWKSIYEVNKTLIKDPDLIQPGWKLKIPAANKSRD
jgi:nucleoid-associated protein YgaU